jgi:hypothetical protein
LFNDVAIAALITWGDIEEELVDDAICDNCYKELRDVLIENSDALTEIDPMPFTKAG